MSPHYIAVLDIKKKALDIRENGTPERIQRLEEFLQIIPFESNYYYELRCGLFGFSSEFIDLTGRRRSHSTLAKHIAVEKLLPQCEVSFTLEQYTRFSDL